MECVEPKRLWNVLRVTFFMIRKGLISKRKMIMDMNLMMKKRKVVRESLSNLMSSHSHHHNPKSVTRGGGLGVHYEFSCSNSPATLFYHHMPKRNKHHFNFPCIKSPEVVEEEEEDFSFEVESDVPKAEVTKTLLSPFSVRVSNYSSLDENEDTGNDRVDDEAEDFIRRFYEQLRTDM